MFYTDLHGTRRIRARGAWISTFAAIAAVLILGQAGQANAAGKLPAAANTCLTCHSMPALSKTMENGDKVALHIDKNAFAGSVHSVMGCAGCHSDVDPSAHPSMTPYPSARAFSVSKKDSCKTCHSAKYGEYEDSIHGKLVESGNPDAPVCSSCHDVHAQQRLPEDGTYSGQVCRTCHDDIFKAYEGSVHGKAKFEALDHAAPICADCHSAHQVHAVSSGDRLKSVCIDCHEDTKVAHSKWLPNSGLHLKAVSCPACHSPTAERSVDLMMYDANSDRLLGDLKDDPRFEALVREVDSEGDGLDPMELWQLVRAADREGIETSVKLRGRLEVRGKDAHELALKDEAIRDCNTCHEKGAAPFENVTISVTDANGQRISYDANEDTLTSAVSVDSVSDFYTAGGTRIGLLDALLVLALMAGIGIPLTHWSIRKWFKSKN